MRSALAKGLGVDEDAVFVDFATKTAHVALGDREPDMRAVDRACGSNNYTITLAE